MSLKAALLDMDGTLIDSESIYEKNIRTITAEYGYEYTEKDDEEFLGEAFCNVYPILKERFPIPCHLSFEDFSAKCQKLYQNDLSEDHLFPDALTLLNRLKEAHIPICLVTNTENISARFSLEKTNILSFFDEIITVDQVQNAKPHHEPYMLAAEKLGFSPKECLAVEDSPTGLLSASKAGCHVIEIQRAQHMSQSPNAHKMVMSLEDIPLEHLF